MCAIECGGEGGRSRADVTSPCASCMRCVLLAVRGPWEFSIVLHTHAHYGPRTGTVDFALTDIQLVTIDYDKVLTLFVDTINGTYCPLKALTLSNAQTKATVGLSLKFDEVTHTYHKDRVVFRHSLTVQMTTSALGTRRCEHTARGQRGMLLSCCFN